MERPTCDTCAFWRGFKEYDPSRAGEGLCQRNPPIPKPGGTSPGDWPYARWVLTTETDWCGEHPGFPIYMMSIRDSDLDESDDEPDEDTSEAIEDLETRVSAIEATLDAERTLRIEQSERS